MGAAAAAAQPAPREPASIDDAQYITCTVLAADHVLRIPLTEASSHRRSSARSVQLTFYESHASGTTVVGMPEFCCARPPAVIGCTLTLSVAGTVQHAQGKRVGGDWLMFEFPSISAPALMARPLAWSRSEFALPARGHRLREWIVPKLVHLAARAAMHLRRRRLPDDCLAVIRDVRDLLFSRLELRIIFSVTE